MAEVLFEKQDWHWVDVDGLPPDNPNLCVDERVFWVAYDTETGRYGIAVGLAYFDNGTWKYISDWWPLETEAVAWALADSPIPPKRGIADNPVEPKLCYRCLRHCVKGCLAGHDNTITNPFQAATCKGYWPR